MNNTRAVAVIFFAGLFSFSVLGVLLYMVNIGFIGGLFALFAIAWDSTLADIPCGSCAAWHF